MIMIGIVMILSFYTGDLKISRISGGLLGFKQSCQSLAELHSSHISSITPVKDSKTKKVHSANHF